MTNACVPGDTLHTLPRTCASSRNKAPPRPTNTASATPARGLVGQHQRSPRRAPAARERRQQHRRRSPHRRGLGPEPVADRWRSKAILIRADGAGYSHALISALSQQGLEFSVGYPVTDAVRDAIAQLPEWAWQEACNADGDLREHADVVEVTGLLDLSNWTTDCPGMRVIVRRELPHPGATLDAFEVRDGYRYQAFNTNTARGQLAFLEARHRAHARVEDRIRTGKDTGLGHLPSRHQNINEVWVELALIAADLLALAQSMLLTCEPELHRAEPKTLRYRLLHVTARITRGQRKVFLRLAEHWPWALALARTFPDACGRSHSRPDSQHNRHLAPPTKSTETPDTAPALADIVGESLKIIRSRSPALLKRRGQHRLRIAQVLHHVVAQVITDPVRVPVRRRQQPLHPIRAGLTGQLGQRPAVLALQRRQQATQIRHHPLARL